MINNDEGINDEYSNYINDPEKTNEKNKSSALYGSNFGKNEVPSSIQKNQARNKTFVSPYNLEEYKDKHYACKECISFPLKKIINDNKSIILLLKCENDKHKEKIELNKYCERILKNNSNINLNFYSYCKFIEKK